MILHYNGYEITIEDTDGGIVVSINGNEVYEAGIYED